MISPIAISFLFALTGTSLAENQLGWSGGVGTAPCTEVGSISEQRLQDWVLGYWTGANLYVGGNDLCRERAAISGISSKNMRSIIENHCKHLPNHSVMVAAFNALKELPTISGSRSAKCKGASQ
ncbi:MAG: hypothetical protein ACPGGK_16260 [Pikeienuella sp.]